jgi:energy-coupling factor transport system substrate-specific component
VLANLARYLAFYLATSLGWDLPRGVLTAVLVMVAGRPVLASLRRGTRRAAFGTTGQFVAGGGVPSERPGAAEPRLDPVSPSKTR